MITENKILSGRSLVVIDDAVSLSDRLKVHQFIKKSYFKIGGSDTEYANYPYLVSEYSNDDVAAIGFIDILNTAGLSVTMADVNRTLVNLCISNEPHWYHTHIGETVILYYVNPDWTQEWGGETLFMNDKLDTIEFASPYTPGRIVAFNGDIPHTLRPQSIVAPTYRFTLAMFVNKNIQDICVNT